MERTKVGIGNRYADNHGNRWVVTGFCKDRASWQELILFYDYATSEKWAEPFTEFLARLDNGKLTLEN